MKLKHVISAQQFDRSMLKAIFRLSHTMEKIKTFGGCEDLSDKIMATIFYEPSTRTRLSFETAMMRMGGRIISTENARDFSSAIKGENLEDTIRVIAGYADIIVLRHNEEGASARAAQVSPVPIINAGDGPGQHPTQALLDLYTIQKELGTIDGLTIALVGDLAHGRAVRSLAYLLAKYNVKKILLVSPKPARMQDDVKEYLARHGISFEETSNLRAAACVADVIYQTRVQTERYTNPEDAALIARERQIIDASTLKIMKQKAIVLHPLPRSNEIAPDVDADPRAAYFRQAQNGLFVRMALLKMLLTR